MPVLGGQSGTRNTLAIWNSEAVLKVKRKAVQTFGSQQAGIIKQSLETIPYCALSYSSFKVM